MGAVLTSTLVDPKTASGAATIAAQLSSPITTTTTPTKSINVSDSMSSANPPTGSGHSRTYVQRPARVTDKSSWDYVSRSFVAGGVAGCVAKTCVAPLDRVKILFQTNNPHYAKYSGSVSGIHRAARAIYGDFGIRGLFQGHSVTLLRIFPYAAIKYMAYEQVKNLHIPFTTHANSHVKHFVAGSIAGSISVFVSYPLDLLRVRLAFQVRNSTTTPVMKPSTMSGAPTMGRLVTYLYDRSVLFRTVVTIFNEPNPAFSRLPFYSRPTISGASSTATSSRPFLSTAANSLVGIMNFYHGFVPTIYGIIPYAGVSFLVYENLKRLLKSESVSRITTRTADHMVLADVIDTPIISNPPSSLYPSKVSRENKVNGMVPAKINLPPIRSSVSVEEPQLKGWSYFLCGAISGAISQTVAYPLEVIRRNMQVDGVRRAQDVQTGEKNPTAKLGTLQTAKQIYSLKGWRGFFVGLSIGYIKVIPMSATSFFVYEFMKDYLNII